MKSLLQNPTQIILALATVLLFVVLGATYAIDGQVALVGGISVSFLLVGFVVYRQKQTRDVGAATALIGQAIALTAAFQGHPWQMDTHMLFFALLACLIVLRNIPAILMATVITAVHHLSLTFMFPALVYPGVDIVENLGRTILHAAIIVLETAVLVATVLILKRLDAQMLEKTRVLENTVAESERARQDALSAQETSERLQQEAESAQANAETLLDEARAAEQLRKDAEAERAAAQEELSRKAQETAAEQARVVGIIRQAMQRVQNGDLTARIDNNLPETYRDLGDAFNEALDALDSLVCEVAVKSQDMQSQVQEIATATAGLATRTEQQAEMLHQSSEGLESLTEVIAATQETVREADGSAKTAQSSAKCSEAIVSDTAKAMEAIHAGSVEIFQIVKVIDEIAFQTNLLALNAGVEAARAGDAGRGFAVVASEVRALAQRSSESATSIRGLIERSGEQVEAGTSKIEETVSSLNAVLEAVFEITAKTGRIAEGTHAQTEGVSDLNRKVAQLDTTTQHNAALFEETSAACAELQGAAETLQRLTQKFTVTQQRSRAAA